MLPPENISVVIVVLLAAAVAAASSGGDGKSLTLTLERASHEGVELSRLRDRDRVRHGRFLQQQNGVVDFPVGGTYNPLIAGLYYTTVSLGTPAKEFYVQIDTGSDVLWVSCNPCSGCPKSSGLKIKLNNFDTGSSSTSSMISCSDKSCSLGTQSSQFYCSNQNQCGYKFQYGDGSGTSGFYVSDMMYLDTAVGDSSTSNASAQVVFGCSTSVTGDLTKSDSAVAGIFGFGRQGLSVITQLSSQGLTPNAFSHCLNGDSGGGGILVLGSIVDPSIVYTPLVPSQPHYNVNLQSISVNGQPLSIAASVFSTSDTSGTIIDSGTTLAYLADGAYDPFINAVMQTVSQSIQPVKGNQCFLTTNSIDEIFPNVSLNFAGGASMVLMPRDYFLQQPSSDGVETWCIGIQKFQGQDITVLGDLILKNKIVVYDLDGERIGWTNYNCSLPVNVSTSNTSTTQYVNSRHLNNSNSGGPHYESHGLIYSAAVAFMLHIAFYGALPFLL